MRKKKMIQIHRLQENLSSIRKIAGWSAEDLGNLLGVSKQNISNLEKGHINLSQSQYIAIRYLIDYKASSEPNNETLLRMVYLLVDRLDLKGASYNLVKDMAINIGMLATRISGRSLQEFADTLLRTLYRRSSEFTGNDEKLKNIIESNERIDWTADLFTESKNEMEIDYE